VTSTQGEDIVIPAIFNALHKSGRYVLHKPILTVTFNVDMMATGYLSYSQLNQKFYIGKK